MVLAGVCALEVFLETVFAASAVQPKPTRKRQAKHSILTFSEILCALNGVSLLNLELSKFLLID